MDARSSDSLVGAHPGAKSVPGNARRARVRSYARHCAGAELVQRYSARVTCPHKPISASTAWA